MAICKLDSAGVKVAGDRIRDLFAYRRPGMLLLHAANAYCSRAFSRVQGEMSASWTTGRCGNFADILCAWLGPVARHAKRRVLLTGEGAETYPLHSVVRVGDYYLDANGAQREEDLLYSWGPDGFDGRRFKVRNRPTIEADTYMSLCRRAWPGVVKHRRSRAPRLGPAELTWVGIAAVDSMYYAWLSAGARLLDRHVGRAEDLVCAKP